VLYKIVIHFMEELRLEAETRTVLNDEDLDLLYFCCHRLIKFSGYSDEGAAVLMRKTATQSDQQLALDRLLTQKASGWQLPMYRNAYWTKIYDDGRWHCGHPPSDDSADSQDQSNESADASSEGVDTNPEDELLTSDADGGFRL
jgi:hypothetical protein